MPTYEYRCDACNHEFEKFQSMTARPVRQCPECGKRKVRRLISGGAGFLFKGDGFYITDYRSDSYKESAKKDKESSSSSSDKKSGDSKKSDSTKKTKEKAKKEAA